MALTDADCMGREEIAQERLRGSGKKYKCADLYGPAGCSKRQSSKAAGRSATEAYPWGTLQGDERLRTPLADFFSILLESDADFIQVS